MSNPKQTIEFEFAGKTYSFRPTWDIIVAIEGVTNESAYALGQKILRGQGSFIELSGVLGALLKGREGAPDINEIPTIMMEDGTEGLIAPIGLFLCSSMRGNKEHERLQKERADKEAAEKAAEDPPEGEHLTK